MKSPDPEQLQRYLEGVAAQIEGWLGATRQVGEENVTDIVLVVKTENDTVKVSRHFTAPAGDP
jgi:hypothetical protein